MKLGQIKLAKKEKKVVNGTTKSRRENREGISTK